MVNYVLSFCKITGASKIFKRNFYLPLLKPLTPKDAYRTFKITGKWLIGSKKQHYIPVLLNHRKKRSKKVKNYGKKPHQHTDDYTYMTPILDPENESQKLLMKILESKKAEGCFVYTVQDRGYNIVLQPQLEIAIRDGDVIDLLVSQQTDKILVKMKDFKKVPIEIQYFEQNGDKLFHGEGATSPEEEQFHHHGKYTMSLAKIFEDKEMMEEKWEEELRKILLRRRRQRGEGSKEWRRLIKDTIRNLGRRFEEEAKKVIDEIEEPAVEQEIEMEIDDLEATKNVNETILKSGPDLLDKLPTMSEIGDIIKNMGNASLEEIEAVDGDDDGPLEEDRKKRRVSGVKVTLSSGKECFVSGQMVHTEDGDVFVPGQTIQNEFGLEYAPGITINVDNKPTLISGLIMGEEEEKPMFLPTQSTITADGTLTFAQTPEERPRLDPEKVKERRRKREMKNLPEVLEEEVQIIIIDNGIEEDHDSSEVNSVDLEELDIEAIRLKHEQQRLELEKLKMVLLDDGMDDLIASLEDKKAKLKQQLEELRRLSITNENSLVSYVKESDTLEFASKISEDTDTINRLSDILMTTLRRAATFRDKNSINAENINQHVSTISTETDEKFSKCSNKLKVLLKTAMVAANDVFKTRPKDQILALNSIADIITDVLKNDNKTLETLLNLMNTPMGRNEVCDIVFKQLTQKFSDTKVGKLNSLAKEELSIYDVETIMDKIMESELKSEAFIKIAKLDEIVLKILSENLQKCLPKITEANAGEILEASVNSTVDSVVKEKLDDILVIGNFSDFRLEALGFAKVLNQDEVLQNLEKTKNLRCCSKPTGDLLKRVILMKQLAERDYSLKKAIERIRKNPERAQNDPRIRQLIRESAVFMPKKQSLRNSRDIPTNLLKTQNLLAIEDFLIQRIKIDSPVLVSRNTMQAVIPREAARGVLAGRVAYILIDESGVTNFKPMHMLSVNNLNKNREKRIDDYLNVGVRDFHPNSNVRKFELVNRKAA